MIVLSKNGLFIVDLTANHISVDAHNLCLSEAMHLHDITLESQLTAAFQPRLDIYQAKVLALKA